LDAESLLSLAASVAGERRTEHVLHAIVGGLAEQPGVALARVWLIQPGDLCNSCFLRSECPDQTKCLHLVASAGHSRDAREEWSNLQGHFRRIPLGGTGKVGSIGAGGDAILIEDHVPESQWIRRPEWARGEEIRSFTGHPLVFRGKTLGVLALFSRLPLNEQDSSWIGIFADQAAVAIANAEAFEEQTRAGEALAKSARELKQVIDVSPAHMFIWEAGGNVSYGNRSSAEYFGPIPRMDPMAFLDRVTHPEDVSRLKEAISRGMARGEAIEAEARMRRHDGEYRWFRYQLYPLRNEDGTIARWCGTRVDIDDQKRAVTAAREENIALREHFNQLQQIMDVVPLHMFTIHPDGSHANSNKACREYFAIYEQLGPREFISKFVHPDDQENMWTQFLKAREAGEAFQIETRLRGRDGQYRWFLEQLIPIRDSRGQIARWCGVRNDITDQKLSQERARQETLALREEINTVSMFEEIVGASPALQAALTRVAQVAKTDSTVLITGETGTGKELIARAIHNRSARADHAFIGVNCAAIPKDLIPSELFGHEKGAFTGALQRRIGRFEQADGGTIFLDEIGDLPLETQVALLRVLQEREFGRVGGSQPIRVDTRVLAATNRDLAAAVADGTFRSDLLYRINVFPIQVPPLRERKEDIRLLAKYFVDRFASKMGKKISRIDKKSLAQLEAYPWPGNIRELQNVIERSVIVCESDVFSVDENWLFNSRGPGATLSADLESQEKTRIEEALAATQGKISGASGAAKILGMAPSTLDSRIKALKINKRRFQSP
jgi:formate hydrogenlyase transcriptional activator